jgi:hypothetical protein
LTCAQHDILRNNHELRRTAENIQALANHYQSIIQLQVNLHRRWASSGYIVTPEIKREFDRLLKAEADARSAYNTAAEGWHEPIFVSLIN